MKKFNLVLLVLVAVLFGSSFVACSNGYSGFDDPETPAESYVTAIVDIDGAVVTFIPCPNCSTIEDVRSQFGYTGETLATGSNELVIDDFFRNYEDVNDRIRSNESYYNGEFIILKDFDVFDTVYILDTTGTYVVLTAVTAPESAR